MEASCRREGGEEGWGRKGGGGEGGRGREGRKGGGGEGGEGVVAERTRERRAGMKKRDQKKYRIT